MRWERLVAIVPAFGLGWACLYAIHFGTSGGVVFNAAQEMSEWSAGAKSRPTAERLARLRGELERASEDDAADPAVPELLGLLYARSVDQQEYLGGAGVHFSKAVELRPTSPNSWANIAVIRYRSGDTGRVFESALVNAAQLGPFEPEVQGVVADYGLAVYEEVAPSTRRAIEAMVARGMKRKPLEMLQIADRRGRLDVACRHLAGFSRQTDSKVTQLCPSLEATP
jgi:hypothetical protein